MEKYIIGQDATVGFNLLKDFCLKLGVNITDINECSNWDEKNNITLYQGCIDSVSLDGDITPEKFMKIKEFLLELEANAYIFHYYLSINNFTLTIDFNGGF